MEIAKEVFQLIKKTSIDNLDGTPEETLSKLTEIFSRIVKAVDFVSLAEHIQWHQKFDSHVKFCFLEEFYNEKVLKLELIRFENQVPTPLHTHPEIIIEEIIEGSLQEQIYTMGENGAEYQTTEVRSQGHHRGLYDDQGHPHIVQSISDMCLNLCLSFGYPSDSLQESL